MRGFVLEVSYTGGAVLRLGVVSRTPEWLVERVDFLLECRPCPVAVLAAWSGTRPADGTWRSGSWRLYRTDLPNARRIEQPQ
jgi:hypothetical protein